MPKEMRISMQLFDGNCTQWNLDKKEHESNSDDDVKSHESAKMTRPLFPLEISKIKTTTEVLDHTNRWLDEV